MRTVFQALAVLAISASVFALPPPDSVTKFGYVHLLEEPTDNEPAGWYYSRAPFPQGRSAWALAYLAPPHGAFDFQKVRDRFCEMEGILEKDAIDDAQGREGVYDLFRLTRIKVAPEDGLRVPILKDLQFRGVDIIREGTPEPEGGLTRENECPHGDRVVWLPMGLPVGPDHYGLDALICLDGGVYWAVQSGGFAGTMHWVGPFTLPGIAFVPSRVKPDRIRARRKVRRKTIRIFRAGEAEFPYSEEAWTPSHFDFGPGVEVTEVRRANARRIKVRVEVAPDAVPGMRDVSVRDQAAAAAFEVRARR